jgi:Flp pilus assembly protein TadG
MVEMAILLPTLLVIMLGAIDFGRFAYYYIATSNAAGVAVRFGSMHPYTAASAAQWTTEVMDAARDDMQGVVGYDASKLTIQQPTVTSESVSYYQLERVNIQLTYQFVTIVPWPGIPANLTIVRRASSRIVR